jgi:hypothetical protein
MASTELLVNLKHYHAQVEYARARFASGPTAPNLSFQWGNTLSTSGETVQRSDLAFEAAAVLYNLAAVASALASRSFADGSAQDQALKEALQCAQTAASAVHAIQQLQSGSPLPGDLSASVLGVLRPLYTAQAAECSLVKAIGSGMKNATVAKVAMYVAELYDEVHTALFQLEIGKDHPWRWWPLYIRAKSMHCRAMAHIRQGEHCSTSNEWGMEVGYLRVGFALLLELEKAVAKEKAPISITPVLQLKAATEHRLRKAEADNNSIFHELVPTEATLPPVVATKLFALEPYRPDSSERDILARLKPLQAHLAESEFSERKAQMLREIEHEVGSVRAAATNGERAGRAYKAPCAEAGRPGPGV